MPTSATLNGVPRGPARRIIRAGRWAAFANVVILAVQAVALAAEPRAVTDDGRLKRDLVVAPGGGSLLLTVQHEPSLLRLERWRLAEQRWDVLHPDATKSEFEPALSRDGQLLAYVQSRGNLSLAVMIENLATGAKADVPPVGGFCGYSSPAISPDGQTIAYSFPDAGRQRILGVRPDAKGTQVLVDSLGVNNWPDFSPDGRWLAFGSSRDGNFELYRQDLRTGSVEPLTDSPGIDARPRFSPDGSRLAFVSHRDGNAEIYILTLADRALRRVTQHPERDDFPAWHPDGRQLYFIGERDGRFDVYLVAAAPDGR